MAGEGRHSQWFGFCPVEVGGSMVFLKHKSTLIQFSQECRVNDRRKKQIQKRAAHPKRDSEDGWREGRGTGREVVGVMQGRAWTSRFSLWLPGE